MDVLDALAASSAALTSAQLARQCGITTSTCALVLGELEDGGWVARYDDRRYRLGSGLFGLVRALRNQFPLLDQGRTALVNLHESLAAGCSMSRIDEAHLTIIDAVGHTSDSEHVVGQRFPIDPPFGLVAMAWRDEAEVDRWLRGVTPRLTRADIDHYRQVLADVRERGYGAWRFDDAHASLHDRVSALLASLEPTAAVARQLTKLMTMVNLRSITRTLETDLLATEFVVLPIFGRTGQPEYQIEIHVSHPAALTLDSLNTAFKKAQNELTPGVSAPLTRF
ncbi:helix-turn-helix domain-containing protein [Mycobacterium sp. JS623]|uniref:helix-turn-helix domain-containing protein n=1 Tax=Mycobacterium sp. JS623 TaxID=212767 RepID=UPI0002F6F1B1|nr:helix-turn-helix domain-containing protein [Mycobacterium sp. JS623]